MMMLVDTDRLWRWRRKSKSQWSSWFSWWWWLMTMTTRKVQFGYLRWILTTLTHLAWLHCVGANTALCYTQIDSPTGQHVWHREPVRAHLFTSGVVHAKQQEINLRNKLQHTMLNLVNITNTLFPFIVVNFEKKWHQRNTSAQFQYVLELSDYSLHCHAFHSSLRLSPTHIWQFRDASIRRRRKHIVDYSWKETVVWCGGRRCPEHITTCVLFLPKICKERSGVRTALAVLCVLKSSSL